MPSKLLRESLVENNLKHDRNMYCIYFFRPTPTAIAECTLLNARVIYVKEKKLIKAKFQEWCFRSLAKLCDTTTFHRISFFSFLHLFIHIFVYLLIYLF